MTRSSSTTASLPRLTWLRPVTHFLLILLTALIVSYMYFVIAIAAHAAAKKHVQNLGQELRADIATLEADFLYLTEEIDLELAYELGYFEVSDPLFVHRELIQNVALER